MSAHTVSLRAPARKAIAPCDCEFCAQSAEDVVNHPEWFAPPLAPEDTFVAGEVRTFKVAIEDVPSWMDRLARSNSGNWIVSHDGTVVINDDKEE